MARRAAVLAAVVLVATALGCPGRRPGSPSPTPPEAEFGVYRATWSEPGRKPRSFRVWLYAAPPDRLHAELLPPVGGPEAIVDAGSGRFAVTVVRRRTAWTGDGRRAEMERVFGFPVGVDDLVAGLLDGRVMPGPVAMVRTPATGEGLPRRFRLEWKGRVLALELRRRRPLSAAHGAGVGTGAPPAGVELRPLGDLADTPGPPLLLPEG